MCVCCFLDSFTQLHTHTHTYYHKLYSAYRLTESFISVQEYNNWLMTHNYRSVQNLAWRRNYCFWFFFNLHKLPWGLLLL